MKKLLILFLLTACSVPTKSDEIMTSINDFVKETKESIAKLPSECKSTELALKFELIANKAEMLKATQEEIIAKRDSTITRLKFISFILGALLLASVFFSIKKIL